MKTILIICIAVYIIVIGCLFLVWRDILQETENEKMKNGVVFGKYASKITCDDLSEWENSSAGIDTNNHARPERLRAKEEP